MHNYKNKVISEIKILIKPIRQNITKISRKAHQINDLVNIGN